MREAGGGRDQAGGKEGGGWEEEAGMKGGRRVRPRRSEAAGQPDKGRRS